MRCTRRWRGSIRRWLSIFGCTMLQRQWICCRGKYGRMFDFLKRAIGMAGAYSAGKDYERSYKLAQLSTIIYLHKQFDGDDGERTATCVWSYLFCTEPTDQGWIEFREHGRLK